MKSKNNIKKLVREFVKDSCINPIVTSIDDPVFYIIREYHSILNSTRKSVDIFIENSIGYSVWNPVHVYVSNYIRRKIK